MEALGEGRARLNAHATFGGSGKSVMKRFASFMSPSTRIISRGAPPWITRREFGGGAGKGNIAVAHRATFNLEPAVFENDDVIGFPEAESDPRIEVPPPAPDESKVCSDMINETWLIGSVGSWAGLRAAHRPSEAMTGTASRPHSVAS